MSAVAALRNQMRARRRALPVAERHACARQLARRVTSLKVFNHAHHIAAYLAVDGEIDPAPLLERAWTLGKQVYLPVLAGTPAAHLLFAPYHRHSAMQANRFGIQEPVVPTGELLPPQRLNLVLTPLVAFDASGTRLGMGGGFYDRSFAFRNNPAHLPRPLLLGVAYEVQKVAELPRQAWDIPLDGIITEQAVYSVPGSHLLE